MKHTLSYIEGHPRPQFTRRAFISLDGEWDFCFDEKNCGKADRFYRDFPAKPRKIRVPYAYQSEASGIGEERRCDVVWYRKRTKVSVPAGKRALLHFEGADYLAEVWINGAFVGSHKGAYARFTFDISEYLSGEDAEIVVRCEDTESCAQPRGKQKWEARPFGCWYTETTGIWKSVWLEYVGKSYLERAKITADISDYSARFEYDIAGFRDDLRLKTRISFNGATVAEDECAVCRPHFAQTFDLTSETDPFKKHFWFPHAPELYDVEYFLYENGKEIDRAASYFGLVGYKTEQNNVTVNDYPVYLKMVLDQGYFPRGWYTPDVEQIVNDVQAVRALGLNGVRKHQKIEDERFYYYCDVLGLYVWLEMPSAFEYSDGAAVEFTAQWLEILRQYENHPSIMALVPFNESWGIPQVFSDLRQQDFSRGVYRLSKALLPEKLVISNDGWEHTESDVVTLHNYAENGEQLKAVYDSLEDALQNNKTAGVPHKFAFAKGFSYAGQPVMLSEFAGISFEKDRAKGWGYGEPVKDEQSFLARLSSLVSAVRAEKGFCGYCITQLTDVQHEINGLFDFQRRCKVDQKKLKRIFSE